MNTQAGSHNRQSRSLLHRVVSANFVLVSVSAVCLTALLLMYQLGGFQHQLQLRAETLAEFLARQAAFPLLVGDRDQLEKLAADMLSGEDVLYVVFSDAEGQPRLKASRKGFAEHRIPDLVSADRRSGLRPNVSNVENRSRGFIDVEKVVSSGAEDSLIDWEAPEADGAELGTVRLGFVNQES